MRNIFPFRPPRPKKPRVTIIAGLTCSNCIVVASDSQTTYGYSSKRVDADKIHIVTFKNGHQVLVAQSGDCAVSGRMLAFLANAASNEETVSPNSVTRCAQSAAAAVRGEIFDLIQAESKSLEEKNLFLNNYEAALMVAFYFEGTGLLLTLDFKQGIIQEQKRVATIGCGGTVADYILSKAPIEKLNFAQATALAIYAVEEVKKVDAHCAGETKVGFILQSTPRKAELAPASQVRDTVEEIVRQDEALNKSFWLAMQNAMSDAAKKWGIPTPITPP